MNVRLRCTVFLLMLAIAGCGGGPKLDASSQATYEASRKAMESGMTDTQKRKFAADVMVVLGPEAAEANMKKTFSKDKNQPASSPTDMYKPLQGMTVEQIQAKAEEIRESKKKH